MFVKLKEKGIIGEVNTITQGTNFVYTIELEKDIPENRIIWVTPVEDDYIFEGKTYPSWGISKDWIQTVITEPIEVQIEVKSLHEINRMARYYELSSDNNSTKGITIENDLVFMDIDFRYTVDMEKNMPSDRCITVSYYGNDYFTWKVEGSDSKYLIHVSWVDTYRVLEVHKETTTLFQGSLLNQALSSQLKHSTHYFKFQCLLNDVGDIRYYLNFEDRPHLKGKFVLKINNLEEKFVEIPPEAAKALVLTDEPQEEVIGRKFNKNYYKTIITKDEIKQIIK